MIYRQEGNTIDTNRLIFTDLDQSQYTISETDIKAYFTVNAPRGTLKALLLSGGDFDKFVQSLGVPTKDYPGLKEAYDYIVKNGRSAWVSAPPGVANPEQTGESNYYGGCYITTVAEIYSFYQVSDYENPNFYIGFTADSGSAAATQGFDKGIAVSVDSVPSNIITIDDIPEDFYNLMVVGAPDSDPATPFTLVFSDGTALHTVTGFVASGDNWTASDGGDTITGTFTDNGDGTVKLDFTGMTTLETGDADHVQWTSIIDATNYVIASIYQKSQREDTTTLTFSTFDLTEIIDGEDNPLYDSFKLGYSELITNYQTLTKTAFYLSAVPGAKDGQGSVIDLNTALDSNNMIGAVGYLNTIAPLTGYTWPVTSIVIGIVGNRLIIDQTDEDDLAASLAPGWVEAASTEYSEAVLFVEPECYEGLADDMASVRTGTHKVQNFLTGVKFTQTAAPTSGEIETRRGDYPYNKGLSFCVNEFYMSDYTGKYYWHIPVGHVATMLAQIIEQRYGGVAPMWLNESGLGGQLTTFSAKKQKYAFDADDLDNMDSFGFNPIVQDAMYGYMLTSQKTGQSPSILTDWSFLGHQMAFDSLKREIRTNVMIPQLGKPISDYYIDLRTRQVQAIVDKRLNAGIWAEAKVLIREVNTDDTKAENKFIIKVRVKVNPFSEYVELILLNVGQNVSI